jgi:hypothetical protein
MEKRKPLEAIHTWLIMMKASQAVARYALSPILAEGLGDSDFRVLDVLLHKGPMPVNAIGPKVDLNPGSVSVAVDRLYKQGVGQSRGKRERPPRSHRFADGEGAPWSPHSDTFHGAEISTAGLQYSLYCMFLLFLLSS